MKDKRVAAGLLLGYARVSTYDQDLTNQRTELSAVGCIKLFSEKSTSTRRNRPELAEPWADTTTPAGHMLLTVFGGIVEFERSLIIDRTKSGREAAKARGVKFGPKPALTAAQIDHARELIDQEGRTVKEAAALLSVHRSTLYRARWVEVSRLRLSALLPKAPAFVRHGLPVPFF